MLPLHPLKHFFLLLYTTTCVCAVKLILQEWLVTDDRRRCSTSRGCWSWTLAQGETFIFLEPNCLTFLTWKYFFFFYTRVPGDQTNILLSGWSDFVFAHFFPSVVKTRFWLCSLLSTGVAVVSDAHETKGGKLFLPPFGFSPPNMLTPFQCLFWACWL